MLGYKQLLRRRHLQDMHFVVGGKKKKERKKQAERRVTCHWVMPSHSHHIRAAFTSDIRGTGGSHHLKRVLCASTNVLAADGEQWMGVRFLWK